MAIYEGNIEDFKKFINGYSRNLIQNLTKKHKKNRTCSLKECKIKKNLHAAHLQGKERPKIINKILVSINQSKDDNIIKIDLNEFERLYLSEHEPIDKSIIILCPKHHTEYDNKGKKIDSTDTIAIESEEELKTYSVLTDEEILNKPNEIKIGKFVQNTFKKIVNNKVLLPSIVFNLCDENFCKENFKINLPFLKEFITEKSYYDKKGHPRYYQDASLIFTIYNKKYLLTKEWKTNNYEPYKKWLSNLKN